MRANYAGSKMQRVMNGAQGITNLIRLLFTDLIGAFVAIRRGRGEHVLDEGGVGRRTLAFAASYYILSFFLRRKQSNS